MIREYTPALQIDEIKDFLTIREMGWILKEDDIDSLSAVTSPLEFTLKEYERSPSAQTLFGTLENQISNDLPTITMVDAIRLQEEREDRQIAEDNEQDEHSVVVVGLDDRNVYINDPWGKAREPFNRNVFHEAWDVGLNRLVTATLQSRLNTTARGNT